MAIKKINVRIANMSVMEEIDDWLTRIGMEHTYDKNFRFNPANPRSFYAEMINFRDFKGKRRYHIFPSTYDSDVIILQRGACRTEEEFFFKEVSMKEIKMRIIRYFYALDWPIKMEQVAYASLERQIIKNKNCNCYRKGCYFSIIFYL